MYVTTLPLGFRQHFRIAFRRPGWSSLMAQTTPRKPRCFSPTETLSNCSRFPDSPTRLPARSYAPSQLIPMAHLHCLADDDAVLPDLRIAEHQVRVFLLQRPPRKSLQLLIELLGHRCRKLVPT